MLMHDMHCPFLLTALSEYILGISFEEFQLQDQSNSSLDLQGLGNHQFAIFVSFAEIYNEFVYDLLVETPAKNRRRPVLKISQDKHQNYFIKGTAAHPCIGKGSGRSGLPAYPRPHFRVVWSGT